MTIVLKNHRKVFKDNCLNSGVQEEKHVVAIQEVLRTIEQALDDKAGLLSYQRRIMSMLSLGTQHLIELYLHRTASIQPGAQIKHEWLKLSATHLRERIQPALTKEFQLVPSLSEICFIARKIETERNDAVYGAPLINDVILRKSIDAFLQAKKIVEEQTGKII